MLSVRFLLALMAILAGDVPVRPQVRDASDAFFARETVPEFRFRVASDAVKHLRDEPREYVRAALVEDQHEPVAEVALKLKGAAGSFRPWDDRPALTLNVRKFRKDNQFHDLAKFHLNNSIQDGTYLNEILCSELFRQAGVPTPRVGFARVWINDRDLGLYVLKEGFDRSFLKRWFADPTGNLYDGGFLQDLDADLERDEGTGPEDRRDLRAIVAAAAEADPARRRDRLGTLLDVDSFASFMAIERFTVHWDGYVDKGNNYRIYFDPRQGKAIFLPHGMDQMFADPGWELFQASDRIVPGALLKDAKFRRLYRQRVEKLVPLVAPADALIRRIDSIVARIRPTLAAIDPGLAAGHAEQVADLKQRLVARAEEVRRLLAEPADFVLAFDDRGSAALDGWQAVVKYGEGALNYTPNDPDRPAWRIEARAGGPFEASWRRQVWLDPGVYTLQAEIRADGVVADDKGGGRGVGVGVSGVARSQHLIGTTGPLPLSHSFEVRDEGTKVVLVLELRARAGAASFDARSLRLTRRPLAAPAPVSLP